VVRVVRRVRAGRRHVAGRKLSGSQLAAQEFGESLARAPWGG
jgi:hypothetical protein